MDASALQRRDLLPGREVAQLDLDVWIAPCEQPDDARPVEEVGPEVAGQQELADLAAARALGVARGLLRLRNERSRVPENTRPAFVSSTWRFVR